MRIPAVVSIALSGLSALTCSEALAPPDLVLPIQIQATPDRDTLRLADCLILTIQSDSAMPQRVVWLIEPRGDSLVADTLVYRPRAAGTEFVRARAEFAAGRVGSAVRRVVTLANAAPIVTIVSAGNDNFARVPLGDTVVLIARVTDPDGDTIAAADVRWYLDPAAGGPQVQVDTGDTLQFAATAVDTLQFRLVASDPAGARATLSYTSIAYDPVTPATWRRRIGGVTAIARQPNGQTVVYDGSLAADLGNPPVGHAVVALTASGATAWAAVTPLSGTPLVVGDDGGIYQAGDAGSGTGQRQTEAVKLRPDGTEEWRLPDASAIFGPVLLWDGDVVIPRLQGVLVVAPDGAERWVATLDSLAELTAMAVGADSTLYLVGYSPYPFRTSVAAYTPAGAPRWRVFLGTQSVGKSVVPADDSTVLVAATDSLYALRRDGSVRWSRPGSYGQPLVGYGQAFVGGTDATLVTISLVNGAEVWRATLPRVVTAAAGLTVAGELIVGTGSTIIAFDASSGQERWRHELAGTLSAPMLLTEDGDLIAGDALGYIERLRTGSGPLSSAWPMPYGDERRTSRAQQP